MTSMQSRGANGCVSDGAMMQSLRWVGKAAGAVLSWSLLGRYLRYRHPLDGLSHWLKLPFEVLDLAPCGKAVMPAPCPYLPLPLRKIQIPRPSKRQV